MPSAYPTYQAPGGPAPGGWIDDLQSYINWGVAFHAERDFGAVADTFGVDGVTVAADNTFTSASANFVSGDIGKLITIMRAGPTDALPKTGTITAINSPTSIEVSNAPELTRDTCHYYYGPDNTSAIQAAIDACAAAGGGTVLLPGSYAHTGLVLKHLVRIKGSGRMSTRLRLWGSSNKPAVRNDYTVDANAEGCGIEDLMLLCDAQHQADITTTLASNYTAGNSTLVLTDASNFNPSGTCKIGTSWFLYGTKSGNTLTLLARGIEGTTDASYTSGTTVTHPKAHGIYFYKDPPTTPGGKNEWYDTSHIVRNVMIYDCKGDGLNHWGQSNLTFDTGFVYYARNVGIRASFDSNFSNINMGQISRMGWVLGAMQRLANCVTYYCGVTTAADGYAYFVDLTPPASDYEGGVLMANCSAQDNKADGFYLKAADRTTMTSCMASSNGVGVAGSVGLRLEGAQDCVIDLMCVDRQSPTTQKSALLIDSASQGNTIRITHGGTTASGGVDGPIKAGSVIDASNQIFIGNTLQPTKSADQSVTNSATLTDDTALQVYLAASQKYRITGTIYFDTTATGDFKYGFVGPTTPTLVRMTRVHCIAGGTPAEVGVVDTALPTGVSLVGTGTTGGYISFDCIIHNSTNAGAFKFQFAQNTQTAAESATVRAGSWIEAQLAAGIA